MRDPVEIIKALQATNGRLDKEAIIEKAWSSDHRDEFFTGLLFCYDPFITFGVADKMVPVAKHNGSSFTTFEGFVTHLLKPLSTRKLTGNAAKQEIEEFMSKTDKEIWNLFYRPILLKDIRAGLSETTVNKVLKKIGKETKDYIIQTFECQLAQDGTDEEFEGNFILQEKLDGVRIITICDIESKTVTMYTRNGKENNNFPHIKKVFEDILPRLKMSMVFDGEVVGENFQSLMTQVNRKDHVNSKNTRLALFDCLPLSDFKKEISEISQLQRLEMLDTFSLFSDNSEQSPVFKLDSLIVDMTTDKGKKEFNKFNQTVVAAGKEGIMVKNPDAPYECKRSKSWLKIKPTISVSLPIILVEEGTGKYTGSLGAFVCEGFDTSYPDRRIKVNVGSGFTDEQRKEFWSKRNKLKGMLTEICADCLTKDRNDDTVWSMRFPRFKGFRGSEPGEKV